MRYLLLVVALFVFVWLLRGALSGRRRGREEAGTAPAELVSCAHCGVHVPKAEALPAEGRSFCSEEHRRLGARDA